MRDVAVLGAAVGEPEPYAVEVLLEREAPGVDAEELFAEGLHQYGVKGRSADHDQRRPEAGLHQVG